MRNPPEILNWILDRFEWYRRFCGGHWELWYVPAIHSWIWHHRKECYKTAGRPFHTFGSPTCEDYIKMADRFAGRG